MDRNLYYIGIAFFGMINGIFNPLMAFAYVFSKVLMAVPLFGSESLFFYFAALMLSTATIILGGIPAAIYERFVGAKDDFDGSLAVDLARRHRHPDDPGHRQLPQDRPVTGALHTIVNARSRQMAAKLLDHALQMSARRSISRRGSPPWKTCVALRSRPCCGHAASARSRSSA